MKRLTGIVIATACCLGMMVNGEAKAAPSDTELCNWGKWAYHQNITMKQLVDTLNSVEGMPDMDKLIVVQCFALEEVQK